MSISAKSDVGHLRLESPTSDIEDADAEKPLRVVPLRDLARYAGRLVRAGVAEGSRLLVTDRGRPLAMIVPLGRAAVPENTWTDAEEEPVYAPVPLDLPEDERVVLEVLGERPKSFASITSALGRTMSEYALPLARLEAKRLVTRGHGGWKRV